MHKTRRRFTKGIATVMDDGRGGSTIYLGTGPEALPIMLDRTSIRQLGECIESFLESDEKTMHVADGVVVMWDEV
jgi:hypothetical protein